MPALEQLAYDSLGYETLHHVLSSMEIIHCQWAVAVCIPLDSKFHLTTRSFTVCNIVLNYPRHRPRVQSNYYLVISEPVLLKRSYNQVTMVHDVDLRCIARFTRHPLRHWKLNWISPPESIYNTDFFVPVMTHFCEIKPSSKQTKQHHRPQCTDWLRWLYSLLNMFW